ncbi:hypothetical protein ABTX81_19610 [Kitasatospora sp. NPDC097605]|uniref:hypothetical protein n=1 Tax=Kitasatospora sp. NPDC097605 TaxID=3157226 RepID=UPI0033329B29
MWASTPPDRQAMIKALVLAALPAVAERYAAGVGVRRLATVYGCDAKWLQDQMLKAGYRVRLLEEATGLRPAPLPWEPITLPRRTTMP